jgi:hypothetical protein
MPAAAKSVSAIDATFSSLRRILQRHAGRLAVKDDRPGNYYLETVTPTNQGKPHMFGSVLAQKTHVSLYLMPVYMYPELLEDVSPELKQRMQGKSCFNFKTPDEVLFREIDALTTASLRKFAAEKLL